MRVTPRRACAALFDCLLLFVVFVLLAAAAGTADLDGSDNSYSIQLHGWPAAVWATIALGYFIVLEATAGQTLGKLLFGLHVTRLDGGRPGLGAIVARTVLRLIDGLPILYVLGFLVVIATPGRRRLGDLAAGTIVSGR